MKRTILAARRLEAHRALQTAVQTLAENAGLPTPDLGQRPPTSELDWLQRDEELAAFLGFLAVAEPTPTGFTAEQVLTVDGLTKTSREALEAFFAEAETAVVDPSSGTGETGGAAD